MRDEAVKAFVHDDPEFDDLLRIVAERHGLAIGLVEKDYWVTHALWALHEAGFDVWFKGGTSLSKGFGLITRFSEDLDLKVEPGRVTGLPAVATWRSDGVRAVREREAYFRALAAAITVPGAAVTLGPVVDDRWRCGRSRARPTFLSYPGCRNKGMLGAEFHGAAPTRCSIC